MSGCFPCRNPVILNSDGVNDTLAQVYVTSSSTLKKVHDKSDNIIEEFN